MAPGGVTNWRRPHTSIYNDNYRYGTNLYSGTLSDIQKKYTDSMSKTQLRADRPDLTLSTFAGSNLGSSTVPGGSDTTTPVTNVATPLPVSPTRELLSSGYHSSIFESMLNSALHSSYATDVEEKTVDKRPASRASEQPQQISKPADVPPLRPTSLYDDAGLFTLRKITETAEPEEKDIRRKKKVLPKESTPNDVSPTPQNGPNQAFWKDKCRDLQSQVDILTQAMADMSDKLKGELSTMKSRLHAEITDLHVSLEQSSQQSNDLQKTVKKQATQLMELQTAYEDLQRQLQDSLDEVGGFQRRSHGLRKEMDRLRLEIEETIEKTAARA